MISCDNAREIRIPPAITQAHPAINKSDLLDTAGLYFSQKVLFIPLPLPPPQ